MRNRLEEMLRIVQAATVSVADVVNPHPGGRAHNLIQALSALTAAMEDDSNVD